MDYKFLESPVANEADIEAVAKKAENEGYQLYAGTSQNHRYGKTVNDILDNSNAFEYNGKLFAKTSHFIEEFKMPTGAENNPERGSEEQTNKLSYEDLLMKYAGAEAEIVEARMETEKYKDMLTEAEKTLEKYAPIISAVKDFAENNIAEAAKALTESQEKFKNIGTHAGEIIKIIGE